ncbi:MAG: ATP-grasp domain-containing protein [Janthinobacterium lividum]
MGKSSILCISTYEKGQAFLRECAMLGCEVRLLTVDKLQDADWPKDILTEFLTMPENLLPAQVLNTICYLLRTRHVDRIVPLDEFDLEVAALAREHLRIPGLGESATRLFRDKLAMRATAQAADIRVPAFVRVINDNEMRAFMENVPGPWMLKPRWNASAVGIRKIAEAGELWPVLEELGDLRTNYVLERFVAGEVFHVEGVSTDGEILFAQPFQYGKPPFQTMHQGGVFSTRTLPGSDPDYHRLLKIHAEMLKALGMQAGVTHSEFIRSTEDGEFYFLETAARVGGAYIAETVEFATGLNPWVEWARLEVAAARGEHYALPEVHAGYAGSVISLARQEEPDLSGYTDPEIAMRLHKAHHAGLILKSASEPRLRNLLASYTTRFVEDFYASMPAPDKPTA